MTLWQATKQKLSICQEGQQFKWGDNDGFVSSIYQFSISLYEQILRSQSWPEASFAKVCRFEKCILDAWISLFELLHQWISHFGGHRYTLATFTVARTKYNNAREWLCSDICFLWLSSVYLPFWYCRQKAIRSDVRSSSDRFRRPLERIP